MVMMCMYYKENKYVYERIGIDVICVVCLFLYVFLWLMIYYDYENDMMIWVLI